MRRTQIYFDEDDVTLLGRAAARTGASRSELVRRAIRTHYGEQTAQTRLAALRCAPPLGRGVTAQLPALAMWIARAATSTNGSSTLDCGETA